MQSFTSRLLISVLVLGAGVVQPQATDSVRRAVDDRQYQAAIEELRAHRTTDAAHFTSSGSDYLLGRLYEKNGQLSAAASAYRSVIDRNSELTPLALVRLAKIARSSGNLLLEAIYLQEIDSAASPRFRTGFRQAQNNFERTNFAGAIARLSAPSRPSTTAVRSTPDGIRDNRALLGKALMQAGRSAGAREIFNDLAATAPNPSQPDDASLTAAISLDAMDGEQAITVAEHEQRAAIYQFNREFSRARAHYQAIVSAENSPGAPAAAFQIGRGYAQTSQYVEATQWFERVVEQYPASVEAKDALLNSASAYSRLGKTKEALSRYQLFIQKYPTDEGAERAHLNIIDVQRDHGDDSGALKWCSKTQEAYRGRPAEVLALFSEARIYLARKEWPEALRSLERLASFSDLQGRSPGGATPAEITFLKGYALEKLGRWNEAIDTYLSIKDGRGEYFGGLATDRLRSMSVDETAGSFLSQKSGALSSGLADKDPEIRFGNAAALRRISQVPDVQRRALFTLTEAAKKLSRFSKIPKLPDAKPPISDPIVSKLLSLGLPDDALAVAEARGIDPNRVAADFSIADRGDKAMELAEPLWGQVPADYPIELIPADQLVMLYPAPYADILLRESAAHSVDPRLLLAIMRQESRFRPDARSFAAARGLMQFVTTTSTRIAESLEITNFNDDDLYEPSTAITFGTRYSADLFSLFPQQSAAVVASYNGGEDNMKRWVVRSRSAEPDVYVSEISFSQTKDYVLAVMANYRMYKMIYDEQLRRR